MGLYRKQAQTVTLKASRYRHPFDFAQDRLSWKPREVGRARV